jgi:uncharacterized membrane protein YgcG
VTFIDHHQRHMTAIDPAERARTLFNRFLQHKVQPAFGIFERPGGGGGGGSGGGGGGGAAALRLGR